jgi:hypothetical protein
MKTTGEYRRRLVVNALEATAPRPVMLRSGAKNVAAAILIRADEKGLRCSPDFHTHSEGSK